MNVIIICTNIQRSNGDGLMKIGYDSYNSPIGLIHIVVDEIGVKKVELFQEEWENYIKENGAIEKDSDLCKEAIRQLDEYFKGIRQEFTVPLSIEGTEFRKKVWQALQQIPYGEVRSYQDIADSIGNPKAVRAVGQANKANRIPIIIPCHRVIGKKGNLVGFAGSRTPTQQILIDHENMNGNT